MWPHEINAFSSWYFTLPATVLLVATMAAVLGARATHNVSDLPRHEPLVRFDVGNAVGLGSLFWLFGLVIFTTLSWLVGGFSRDGKITLFYLFYALVVLGMAMFAATLFRYRSIMNTVDSFQPAYRRFSQRYNSFFHRHSFRAYFVLPLTLIALSILATERVSDFAFLTKWYYIAPTILFFYYFMMLQWMVILVQYADERADSCLRGAERLSKWVVTLSIVLIVWISIYYLLGVEHTTTAEKLYAPTVFYGAGVWALCAVLCTWLATLALAFIHRLRWVQFRDLSKQLKWAPGDDKVNICQRIRKLGGKQATESLRKALQDSSNSVSARLAAARELTELNWQPDSAEARVWIAISTNRWDDLQEMSRENLDVLHEVLDQTLQSPRNSFDGDLLSTLSIPAIEALRGNADPRTISLLIRAVKLSYQPEFDTTHLPGTENANYQKVAATRCAAAHALKAMGPSAISAESALNEVLRETELVPELDEAVLTALNAIRP